VEFALKGLLRFLGIEYPKKHDLAELLEEVLKKEDRLRSGRDKRIGKN